MSLLELFTRRAPNKVFVSVVCGALAGIMYSLLIPLVMGSLQNPDPSLQVRAAAVVTVFGLEVAKVPLALAFAATCLVVVLLRTVSQVVLTRVSLATTSELRKMLYERIARAPLAAFERVGSARLVSILTHDVGRIVGGAQMFPELMTNSVTLAGMLGFLCYLDAAVFWFVVKCIIAGVLTYQVPVLFGARYYKAAGQANDGLQKAINGLADGFKEIKLNDPKRRDYFDTILLDYEHRLVSSMKSGSTIMSVAANYGNMICFVVIGAMSFIFVNYHTMDNAQLSAVIMTLLYVTGPIGILLNVIPQVRIARVSVDRVMDVLAELPEEDIARTIVGLDWDCVRFSQVAYRHASSGFCVGPVDFEFRKGQVTFIVGGNGSGKSTLSKMVTLHYMPTSGQIYFGHTPVNRDTIHSLRQSVAAIYSDFHLFERILGDVDEQQVTHYLRRMRIDHKVRYENGRFSTLSLSDGERRRVALIAAMIEEKQLYVFDEWAADQDPVFKEVFYHEILPSLREQGKAVVCISHDDRYFHMADQVIVLADGKLDRIERHLPKQPARDGALAVAP